VDRLYPNSLADIEPWRARHGTTSDEARKRFMQFAVLECVAAAPIGRLLVFKGGNALRFLHQSPRSTIDLDFTALPTFPDDADEIRVLIDSALATGSRRFGFAARTQRVKRHPPASTATMPTFDIAVGYQFPTDRHYASFIAGVRRPWPVIELEISVNDEVCEYTAVRLDPRQNIAIRACVLEDIVAEKLRALLQQRIRRRNRRQDVYDIARVVERMGAALDRRKVSDYFVRKCRRRSIEPTRSAFDDDIRNRAAYEYDTLFDCTDPNFIPFDRGWSLVLRLVAELDIPH